MPGSKRKRTPGPAQRTASTEPPRSSRSAAARGKADLATDRRDVTSRRELLRRVTTEYDEMPGMLLTAAQAQRLFGLREDICLRVLNALVDTGVLRRDANGAYVHAQSRRER